MRRAGENAGDDGVPHGERQHGVHHKDDEQEEGHLPRMNRKNINFQNFQF